MDLRGVLDRTRVTSGKGVQIQFLKATDLHRRGLADGNASSLRHRAFAEFDRALIREREAEGIALAFARGACKGRWRALTPDQVREIRVRIEAGKKSKPARNSASTATLFINIFPNSSGDVQPKTAPIQSPLELGANEFDVEIFDEDDVVSRFHVP